MTVDYRSINAATVKYARPIPHIDAVLHDICGCQAFSATDLTSGSWQAQLHQINQHLHAFITSENVIQPTITTQGSFNSAANFQVCVKPYFSELRENLLARLNNFDLCYKSKEGHLVVLNMFLRLWTEYRLLISLTRPTFFACYVGCVWSTYRRA